MVHTDITADKDFLDFVGRVARTKVASLATIGSEQTTSEIKSKFDECPPFERVNVTLRHAGGICGSMSAVGESFKEQICNAVEKAAYDPRFKSPLTRADLLSASIEVWVQISSTDLSPAERAEPDCILLGKEGVEVFFDEHTAYYKPSVAITSGIRSSHKLFNSLCRKAGLQEDCWKDNRTILKKTQWICVFMDGRPPEVLIYLRTSRSTNQGFDLDEISRWVTDSCDYFSIHQSWTGAISYIYNPIRGTVPTEPLNIVRACGCLFSMSQAIDTKRELVGPRVIDTTRRLAQFLVQSSRMWESNCRIIEASKKEKNPKLGATALMLAALSYPTLKNEYAAVESELRNSIRRAQKDNGRFLTHFGTSVEGPEQINFFPGQALVASALAVENGSDIDAQICIKAFDTYRDHFEVAPTTAFVGWQIDAWARLAVSLGRDEYALFAYKQADWLLELQIVNSDLSEEQGGFSLKARRPQFSSIVFIEALISALKLAAIRNDKAQRDRYSAAIRKGLLFCQQLQLQCIPNAFFKNPEKCVGGITLNHSNVNVRCDVVQHFLTMALATHANYQLIYP